MFSFAIARFPMIIYRVAEVTQGFVREREVAEMTQTTFYKSQMTVRCLLGWVGDLYTSFYMGFCLETAVMISFS